VKGELSEEDQRFGCKVSGCFKLERKIFVLARRIHAAHSQQSCCLNVFGTQQVLRCLHN
jgi:hypothetical protein